MCYAHLSLSLHSATFCLERSDDIVHPDNVVILCPQRAKFYTDILHPSVAVTNIRAIFAICKCVGGCPVPTRSVFITTAAHNLHVSVNYVRVTSL